MSSARANLPVGMHVEPNMCSIRAACKHPIEPLIVRPEGDFSLIEGHPPALPTQLDALADRFSNV
jgi:hypothetical protein